MDEMINNYSCYIYGIAKKFDGYKDKEDLYQAGYMGLIMALKNYKKELNTKFSTYAYKYIYGEMCKLVREDKKIKINTSILRLKNSVDKATSLLEQKLNRKPSIDELSLFLEMDKKEIEEVLNISVVTSLDIDTNLYDLIPNNNMSIEQLVELKYNLNELNEFDLKLLKNSLNMTEKELGLLFNMSQVQVSRSLKKIKNSIKQKML